MFLEKFNIFKFKECDVVDIGIFMSAFSSEKY
jgi:hypothetical protein